MTDTTPPDQMVYLLADDSDHNPFACCPAHMSAEVDRRAVADRDGARLELRTLRCGLRAAGADPTQLQNLWAQLRLRNRQWRALREKTASAATELDRLRERLAAVAQLVSVLQDYLPGNGWEIAHAIEQCARGEITPAEALED
jgi:hypothetical protein